MLSYLPNEQNYLSHVHNGGWLKDTAMIATVTLLLCGVGWGVSGGAEEAAFSSSASERFVTITRGKGRQLHRYKIRRAHSFTLTTPKQLTGHVAIVVPVVRPFYLWLVMVTMVAIQNFFKKDIQIVFHITALCCDYLQNKSLLITSPLNRRLIVAPEALWMLIQVNENSHY